MKHKKFRVIFIGFFILILSCTMTAQSWKFIKEEAGIKIYTRVEEGKSLKAFKGTTDINSSTERIFAVMEDINHIDWWEKNLTLVKVLLYEKDKRAQYYLIFDSPWPVLDRDLCVDVTVNSDAVTGEHKISAVALNGVIPERKDMVRIKDYMQTWTIVPAGKEMTHVVLEGYVDPAGIIPDWISNKVIIESPFKAINGLRVRMGKN